MPALMQDHPSWTQAPTGEVVRVMRSGATRWIVTWGADGLRELTATPVGSPAGRAPAVDRVDPAEVSGTLAPLDDALASVGVVLRVRNADLWDAVGWAIIRQVIRAGQARLMYQRFCTAYGEPVAIPGGVAYLFPLAEIVVDLPDEAFDRLGMRFKAKTLRAAARAFLDRGDDWAQLGPERLVEELCTVPRIGPWTARAIAADVSGDFSIYPYDDLAVRTWARRAAPDAAWPEEVPAFAARWRAVAGSNLSPLTLLTLAWGGLHVSAP